MQAFLNGAFDAARSNSVFGIVIHLPLTSVFSNGNELLHALGDNIRKQIDFAVHMSGSATRGLNEGGLRAEVAFLVGIKNADQRDFREIEAFSE